jgi:hypothetical protein
MGLCKIKQATLTVAVIDDSHHSAVLSPMELGMIKQVTSTVAQ